MHNRCGQAASHAAPESLRWRSHPVADEFPRSLLNVGVLLGASVAVAVAFGGAGYGLVAAGLLGLSLARYFLPTDFELDGEGATVRLLGHARRVPWDAVRRVLVHREGVFLSPFARRSRLDSFRGTFLRFAGNADEVTRFVRRQATLAD